MHQRGISRSVAFLAVVFIVACAPTSAWAKIRVVASITDLGSIASSVGGDQVEVQAISRPNTDVHRVEVLPSYMVRVSRAQVYLKVGLSLDQWADAIIDGSRNDKLIVVDCSEGIDVLEKPTGQVSAILGDVHPNGNPHFWLDPHNGGIVARTIAAAFGKIDPSHAADFTTRAAEFARAADDEEVKGAKLIGGLAGRNIITYHASWVYFAHAYGLTIVGTIEPVPGIPPTGKHLAELINVIKGQQVGFAIQEPYFSDDAGEFLTRETQIKVIHASPSCDTVDAGSYLAHFDQIIGAIASGQSRP